MGKNCGQVRRAVDGGHLERFLWRFTVEFVPENRV